MFKKIIGFLSLLSFLPVNSQNTIVRYENYKKIDEQHYVSFLVYDNIKSIDIESYLDQYTTFQNLLNDQKFVNDQKFIRNIKKDSISSDIYYGVTSIPGKGYVLYKDKVEKIDWQLKAAKAKILNFNCNLAEATFRGRNYKVWYTTEIPISLGPWKLGGLPGLILKVDIDNGEFTFEATSIIFNSNLKVPEKYFSIYEKNKENIFPYEKFIFYDNKYWEQARKEYTASLPKGVILTDVPPIRNTFIEKSFNWDKNKK